MASVVRKPFAPLDGSRLQCLTSAKNRQNGTFIKQLSIAGYGHRFARFCVLVEPSPTIFLTGMAAAISFQDILCLKFRME